MKDTTEVIRACDEFAKVRRKHVLIAVTAN